MEKGRDHWDAVYGLRGEAEVSWFEAEPEASVREILAACPGRACSLIDVGGGASRLPDALIAEGFQDLTVVDLSLRALELAQRRLGADASRVSWIEADVTLWRPRRRYDVWHDRAVFHFLTTPDEQAAYVATLRAALSPEGAVIIATFAPGGPERCSGLPIMQHDGESLERVLGPDFKRLETTFHHHVTPGGGDQRFQYSRFWRGPAGP